jgi:hypothetical protein
LTLTCPTGQNESKIVEVNNQMYDRMDWKGYVFFSLDNVLHLLFGAVGPPEVIQFGFN